MMFSYKRPRQLTYQNNGGHGNLIYSSTTIFNEETKTVMSLNVQHNKQ